MQHVFLSDISVSFESYAKQLSKRVQFAEIVDSIQINSNGVYFAYNKMLVKKNLTTKLHKDKNA